MIDADSVSLEDRRRQIERALRDAGEPARGLSEPILNLIPRQNVETWILCLNSLPVDEQADYRHDERVSAHSIKQAASALFSWTRPKAEIPDTCVTSLRDCLPEFDRIPD
jgi:hypothetical protein